MEHDLLGEKEVPADALYGVQTARAMENFQISGYTLTDYPELINGFAQVKMAAAMGNTDVGKMKKPTRDAIVKAGQAILTGKYLLNHSFILPGLVTTITATLAGLLLGKLLLT